MVKDRSGPFDSTGYLVILPWSCGRSRPRTFRRSMSKVLFTDLSLSKEVLKSIEELGFETATAIQGEAIPHILAGQGCHRPEPHGHGQDHRLRGAGRGKGGSRLRRRAGPDPLPHARAVHPGGRAGGQARQAPQGIARPAHLRGPGPMTGNSTGSSAARKSSSAPPAASSITWNGAASSWTRWPWSSWTKPTRCWTWASRKTWRRSWRRCRRSGRRCCSAPPCSRASAAWPRNSSAIPWPSRPPRNP